MISHKEIATIAMDRAKNARMENQLQTAQPGPATKVLKSSTKGRRKKMIGEIKKHHLVLRRSFQ
jgi:hypothetical protein